MKRLLISIFAFCLFTVAFAENQTVRFTVTPKLTCQNCENKVRNNLRFEKGIKAIKPSAKKQEIVVTYDDTKTDVPAIVAALKKIGYTATQTPMQGK